MVVSGTRSLAEARIVLGIVVACTVGFGVFVMLPYYAGDSWVPVGIGPLWMLGMIFSIVLAPVAAGLAGYASFVALWLRGDTLATSSRRMYLISLLVALSFLALFATWGGQALQGWAD